MIYKVFIAMDGDVAFREFSNFEEAGYWAEHRARMAYPNMQIAVIVNIATGEYIGFVK
jgi:hypothetical protein